MEPLEIPDVRAHHPVGERAVVFKPPCQEFEKWRGASESPSAIDSISLLRSFCALYRAVACASRNPGTLPTA